MKLATITDFDVKGRSGYLNILGPLLTELATRGHKITVLGAGYEGTQHNYPYSVIPVPRKDMMHCAIAMANNLKRDGRVMDAILVGMDVPYHEAFYPELSKLGVPYYSIFPLEAPPLCLSWATVLARTTKAFPISHFAHEECLKMGVDATYLPFTVDIQRWHPSTPENRENARGVLGLLPSDRLVLFVGQNQERKNLGVALEALTLLPPHVKLALVTTFDNVVGWKIDDLISELKVSDRILKFRKGVDDQVLLDLYGAADLLLNVSKAEGLGMPILEAMACKLPVVAPNHTACAEHITDHRGWGIPTTFRYRDPFGNGFRYFVSAGDVADTIMRCLDSDERQEFVDNAFAYINRNNIKEAADVFEQAVS